MRSGPRHLAGRIVGPVAVEADHAPLDTPIGTDHAGVLGDGVVDGVLAAVGDFDDAAAESTWDGLCGPRTKCRFADLREIDDSEVAVPVPALLAIEALGDLFQRVRVVAGGQHAIVARAGEVEIHLPPI